MVGCLDGFTENMIAHNQYIVNSFAKNPQRLIVGTSYIAVDFLVSVTYYV